MVRKKILILSAFLLLLQEAYGESLQSFLRLVEETNPLLKTSALNSEIVENELASENRLDPISVEYSPFFRRGAGGIASSELIIQQEFDFPTLYSARSKGASAKGEAERVSGQVTRKEVLLEAKLAYLNLVYAMQLRDNGKEKLLAAEHILDLVKKQEALGSAVALEVNNARMAVMSAQAEYTRLQGMVESANEVLRGFASGVGIIEDAVYPKLPDFNMTREVLLEELLSRDPDLKAREAMMKAEETSVKIAKQSLLPKLSVGYRRNTEEAGSVNGFLIGASLPIYSGNLSVKTARRRVEVVRLENETQQMMIAAGLKEKYTECASLQQAIKCYDIELIKESLQLLTKGVEMRHIPLQDYYLQATDYYNRVAEYFELENMLQVSAAELLANML